MFSFFRCFYVAFVFVNDAIVANVASVIVVVVVVDVVAAVLLLVFFTLFWYRLCYVLLVESIFLRLLVFL